MEALQKETRYQLLMLQLDTPKGLGEGKAFELLLWPLEFCYFGVLALHYILVRTPEVEDKRRAAHWLIHHCNAQLATRRDSGLSDIVSNCFTHSLRYEKYNICNYCYFIHGLRNVVRRTKCLTMYSVSVVFHDRFHLLFVNIYIE